MLKSRKESFETLAGHEGGPNSLRQISGLSQLFPLMDQDQPEETSQQNGKRPKADSHVNKLTMKPKKFIEQVRQNMVNTIGNIQLEGEGLVKKQVCIAQQHEHDLDDPLLYNFHCGCPVCQRQAKHLIYKDKFEW